MVEFQGSGLGFRTDSEDFPAVFSHPAVLVSANIVKDSHNQVLGPKYHSLNRIWDLKALMT